MVVPQMVETVNIYHIYILHNHHDLDTDFYLATTDYCYTLYIPSMTWTRQSLIVPLGTSSGPRYQHSGKLQ